MSDDHGSNQRPLGRRYAPDERDRLFLARDAIDLPSWNASTPPRYWFARFNQDQRGDSCVANGWTHRLGDSPRTWPLSWLDTITSRRALTSATGAPLNVSGYQSPQSGETGFRGLLYDQAQLIDEWAETPPEGGTSVRAGATVLRRWGFLSEYRWLHGLDEVISAVLSVGPVVIGTNWYTSDLSVSQDSWLTASGGVAGGHCTVIRGANPAQHKARIQTWGLNLWASFDVLEHLLSDSAEACIPIEAP